MIYLPDVPSDGDLQAFYRTYSQFKTGLHDHNGWWHRFLPAPQHPYVEILEHTGGLSGRRLCEVGCAGGSFLLRARRSGARVYGVELDEQSLATLARRRLPAAKKIDPDQRFDILCAFELIEHLARPAEWLTEVGRAVIPDGRLLLALPNGGEGGKVGALWLGFRVDLEHLNYFSVGALARLLHGSGFCLEHYWEAMQPNVARDREARSTRGIVARAAMRMPGVSPTPRSLRDGSYGLIALARRTSA